MLAASRLSSHFVLGTWEGALHPAWTLVVRKGRAHDLVRIFSSSRQSRQTVAFEDRCHRNVARLYARHLLELALARVATTQFLMTHLDPKEQVPPANWDNWQRKDWTDELLESLGRTKLHRVWSAIARLVSLSILAAPMSVLIPCSYISSSVKDLSWAYALWAIEEAGPSYVKLTQWATTRQDLFSQEFCQYFGKLRDDTVGHAWKDTERILKDDLGELRNIMDLEKTPIGSGCIAQVYRGTLRQPVHQYPAGTEIAVKIQHPGIWHKVCVDFYLLAKAARFLEALPYLNLRYLALEDTVCQFRDIMMPQLDLKLEAQHLRRFNRDFASDDRVSFPHPILDLTDTRILTETFVRGLPIMEFTKREESVRKELSQLGLNTTLKMIFVNDFLHGDLHPGNILVSETDGILRLHLLDCGLVVEMVRVLGTRPFELSYFIVLTSVDAVPQGPQQHQNLVRILGAFTRRQGRLAGQLMVDTSSNCQASPDEVHMFVEGIQQIVVDDQQNNFIEKVGDYIADICYLACKHKVKLEASFVNAALAIEIIEGIATALNPNIVVTTVAMPMVIQAEMMHRLNKFSLWSPVE